MQVKALNFLLLLIIFLTPLIPASFGFGYELIKVLVFLLLTIIAGTIFVYLVSVKKVKIQWDKVKISALIFLLVLAVTSILGIKPSNSLSGIYPYYQGLIVYWFLFLFFLMMSETRGEGFKKVLTWAAVLISIEALFEFVMLNVFKIPVPNYAGRVISTFGQPNLYSGFLLLSLPLIFTKSRLGYLIAFLVSLATIASLSKAAIILLAGLVLFYLISQLKKKGLTIFLLGYFFLNVFIFSFNNSTGFIWDEILKPLTRRGQESYIVEKRIYIIPILLDIYSKSPILGFGLDSINELYKQKFAEFTPELKQYPPLYFNLKNLNIDRSHTYFLDLLIFSGGLGLLSYLYLIYLLFRNTGQKPLIIFLILYLIWTQFQVQSIVHLIMFWFIAGTVDRKRRSG